MYILPYLPDFWAKNEPPFVLGLSWLAITLTAADLAATTDVRRKSADTKDEGT